MPSCLNTSERTDRMNTAASAMLFILLHRAARNWPITKKDRRPAAPPRSLLRTPSRSDARQREHNQPSLERKRTPGVLLSPLHPAKIRGLTPR
ncbi:hypothetical protein N9L68_05590 [bacterium]|nr:hypothetical protein [bacterium]